MYELVSEKPTREMLVKSPLYRDVSENPMMRMIYPFFAGTLTFVRTIETFIEIFCHCFFSFGDDDYDELSHLIHKLNKVSLKEKFHYLNRGKPSRPPYVEFQ
jgi:hypothetical protein